MKSLPTVTYSFVWPMWLQNPYKTGLELSDIVQENRIVFFLKQKGYMQDDEWVWDNKKHYVCMSCAEANIDWVSSEFRITGLGNVPNHIEEELVEHVDSHVKLGSWGVSHYRRNCDKADRT
jgi:hypothetical protein